MSVLAHPFTGISATGITMNSETRGHDAPMACYSTRVLNFDLKSSRLDTVLMKEIFL